MDDNNYQFEYLKLFKIIIIAVLALCFNTESIVNFTCADRSAVSNKLVSTNILIIGIMIRKNCYNLI